MKKKISYFTALIAMTYIAVASLPSEIEPIGWCSVFGIFCP